MKTLKLGILFLLIPILLFISCFESGSSTRKKKSFYYKEKLGFKPNFVKKEEAPQWHLPLQEVKDSIEIITYQSGKLDLKGLLNTTNIDSTKKKKGLVYLHGGFSLGNGDLSDCEAFTNKDFVVLAPSYRGENNNPGFFEYFMGEIDDAESAVNWLAGQEYIYSDSVYVFGHSIGGALSLLLSMNDNCNSQLNGSSGGLYFEFNLIDLVGEEHVPYDTLDMVEVGLRVPVYYLNKLPKTHKMYIGSEDYYAEFKEAIDEIDESNSSKMELIEIQGDHFSSLPKAIDDFISVIENK